MAVSYDNISGLKYGYNVTSITTDAFTITSNPDRVAILFLHAQSSTFEPATGGTFTSSCGGQSGTALQMYYANYMTIGMFGIINPSSGSQTATISWETACATETRINAITFYDVDTAPPVFYDIQTDTTTYGTDDTVLSFTASVGDLSVTGVSCGVEITSDQNEVIHAFEYGEDYGPGTANPTHTWSRSISNRSAGAGCVLKSATEYVPINVTPTDDFFNSKFVIP